VTASNGNRYKPIALLFFVSIGLSLAIALIGPRLLASSGPVGALSYNPLWLVYTAMAFGLVAVATVPFAWRWLFWRRK